MLDRRREDQAHADAHARAARAARGRRRSSRRRAGRAAAIATAPSTMPSVEQRPRADARQRASSSPIVAVAMIAADIGRKPGRSGSARSPASAAGSRSGTGRRRTWRCRRSRSPGRTPPRTRSSDDAQRQQRVRDAALDRRRTRRAATTPAASATIVTGWPQRVRLGVREAVDEREQARRSRSACPGGRCAAASAAACVDEQRAARRRRPGSRTAGSRTGTSASDSNSVRMPPSSRPTRRAAAGDRAEDAERLAALVGVGERRGRAAPSADGASSAPKTPCGARGADEHAERLGARRRSPRRRAKPIRPPMKVHLRPNRSPRRPPSSSRLPNASA